jgi:hypothetical protein
MSEVSSLKEFESVDSPFVYHDHENQLEEVVEIDVEYGDDGVPSGTVVTKSIAEGRKHEFDAEKFDVELHTETRNVIPEAVVENAEGVLIDLASDRLRNDERVLGPSHGFNHQIDPSVEGVTAIRDLLAAEQAHKGNAGAE